MLRCNCIGGSSCCALSCCRHRQVTSHDADQAKWPLLAVSAGGMSLSVHGMETESATSPHLRQNSMRQAVQFRDGVASVESPLYTSQGGSSIKNGDIGSGLLVSRTAKSVTATGVAAGEALPTRGHSPKSLQQCLTSAPACTSPAHEYHDVNKKVTHRHPEPIMLQCPCCTFEPCAPCLPSQPPTAAGTARCPSSLPTAAPAVLAHASHNVHTCLSDGPDARL